MSNLDNPTSQAANYIRRLVSADPAGPALVVNVEDIPSNASQTHRTLVLDLDDGTTIRLDIERYSRLHEGGSPPSAPTVRQPMQVTLDVKKARKWLRDQHRAAEAGDDYQVDIDAAWEAWQAEQSDLCHLIHEAPKDVFAGLPDNMLIRMVIEDDEHSPAYAFILYLDAETGRGIRLISEFEEVYKIGDSHKKGIDAALAVMEEAALVVNSLLAGFNERVGSHTQMKESIQ